MVDVVVDAPLWVGIWFKRRSADRSGIGVGDRFGVGNTEIEAGFGSFVRFGGWSRAGEVKLVVSTLVRTGDDVVLRCRHGRVWRVMDTLPISRIRH
eukprot:476449-Amorphochlora_amoeboformis.AAC.1